MSGTLYLQCRRGDEPWSTLNTTIFTTRDGENEARQMLQDFSIRWAYVDDLAGHQFRITASPALSDAFERVRLLEAAE